MKDVSELENVVSEEEEHLKMLQRIVDESIKEEELVSENLLHPPKETIKRSDKISDKIAEFGGSWVFILSFLGILVIWIAVNALVFKEKGFDPYPFILLNLVLSCIAALQAPVIMMSQNRKEERDRKRAENDYLVNLKSEIQIRSLHQKIDLLIAKEMKKLFEQQKEQLEILNTIKNTNLK